MNRNVLQTDRTRSAASRPVLRVFVPAVRRGFTLPELLIVVAIIGFVSAVGSVRFSATSNKTHAEWAAKRVQADLNMARRRAMVTGKMVSVIFNTGTHSYSMPNVTSLNNSGQTHQMSLTESPFRATFDSVSFPGGTGGATQVVFDHYGAPDSGGSVVVRCGGTTKTVTLNATTGEATIP